MASTVKSQFTTQPATLDPLSALYVAAGGDAVLVCVSRQLIGRAEFGAPPVVLPLEVPPAEAPPTEAPD